MSAAGSLCTGIGGLDMAVAEVFDTELVWCSEIDRDASKVLAARYPQVPNLGDLTAVDWAGVVPVDVMCFGFPCQDLSYAGGGAGIKEGTRSGLWFDCIAAVRLVRPNVVVVENVAALLTRRGGIDFNVVLSGLAEAGYDARWMCVRASDVGAPHRRERIFLVAQDTTVVSGRGEAGDQDHRADPSGSSGELGGSSGPPADGNSQRLAGRTEQDRDPVEPGLGTSRRADVGRRRDPAADTIGGELQRRRNGRALASPGRPAQRTGGQRERGRDSACDSGSTAADAARSRRRWSGSVDGEILAGLGKGSRPKPRRHDRDTVRWGVYEPAIRRWEHTLGRSAPPPRRRERPTEPDLRGMDDGLPRGLGHRRGHTKPGAALPRQRRRPRTSHRSPAGTHGL